MCVIFASRNVGQGGACWGTHNMIHTTLSAELSCQRQHFDAYGTDIPTHSSWTWRAWWAVLAVLWLWLLTRSGFKKKHTGFNLCSFSHIFFIRGIAEANGSFFPAKGQFAHCFPPIALSTPFLLSNRIRIYAIHAGCTGTNLGIPGSISNKHSPMLLFNGEWKWRWLQMATPQWKILSSRNICTPGRSQKHVFFCFLCLLFRCISAFSYFKATVSYPCGEHLLKQFSEQHTKLLCPRAWENTSHAAVTPGGGHRGRGPCHGGRDHQDAAGYLEGGEGFHRFPRRELADWRRPCQGPNLVCLMMELMCTTAAGGPIKGYKAIWCQLQFCLIYTI